VLPEWELHTSELHAAELMIGSCAIDNRTADDLVSEEGVSEDNRWAERVEGSGKRLFDLLVSLLLLCLTGPVLVCAILAIWLESLGRNPVIYRQTRVGLRGRLITVLKLRTMHVDAERDGPRMAATDDPRVTCLGRALRRSRIDELPQLINVLRGEMSLIGPRPERPEFVVQYERQIEDYALRHWVKPGITGLAQVRYSYAESLEDTTVKLYFDLDYIKNCSIWLDLAILLQTLPVVFTGWGAR
jgi:exopolysaccharide biosynthesis polyprenyl glycosylphosphotransferase